MDVAKLESQNDGDPFVECIIIGLIFACRGAGRRVLGEGTFLTCGESGTSEWKSFTRMDEKDDG